MEKAIIVSDQIYDMNETVNLESDYFWDSSENPSGYTLSVESASVIDTEAFLEKWGTPDLSNILVDEPNFKFSRKVFDVTLKVKNQSNTSGKICFFDYILISDALVLRVSSELMQACEPNLTGYSSFKLNIGQEYELHLPFVADPGIVPINEQKLYNRMMNESFYMCVSQFPSRYLIRILPE